MIAVEAALIAAIHTTTTWISKPIIIHCLAQEEVTETSPFDQKMLVDNVIDRTLALADIDTFESIHLKCDLATAIQLREAYAKPLPGNHMHKDHWDTVRTTGSIPDKRML